MPPPDEHAADVWTVARIIDWTTQHLKKHGSETPRLDAEILLAHARGCPRIQLYVDYASPLTDNQRTVMRDFVRRRAAGEPVAYLVGKREFFGLDFRVSPEVLVPRPETETLVMELITAVRKRGATIHDENRVERGAVSPSAAPSEPVRILDLGTGSGCIAVTCAVNLPDAQVTAIDISSAALAVARENARAHRAAERIRFLEGDLFSPLPAGAQFDFIASNPPYVAEGEMATLPIDVRRHEPHLALAGGPKGLDVIERLIAQSPPHLAPGGLMLIEISPEQAPAVSALLEAQPELEPTATIKDASGNLRVATARRRA